MSGVRMTVFSQNMYSDGVFPTENRHWLSTAVAQQIYHKSLLCLVIFECWRTPPIKYQHFRFNLRAGKSSNTSQPQVRSNFLCTFAMLSLLHTATCQYFVSQSSCFTAIEVLNETDKMALKRLAPKHRRGGHGCTGQTQATSGSSVSWVHRCT